MKRLFLLISLCSPLLWSDLTLVDSGRPQATLVLGEQATRSAQLAAFEVQHHLRLITGAQLEIVRTAPANGIRIFIGNEAARSAGYIEPLPQREFSVVHFQGSDIILCGTDSPDYGEVDYRNHKSFPGFKGNYLGSLFAAYDFLEQGCGVRFYWLDESGTTYEARTTLKIPEFRRRHTPPMDAFREIYYYNGDPKVSARDEALWKLRWRMCSFYGQTNHNMASIYFRHYKPSKIPTLQDCFIESRPDYFARGYEGRGGGRGDWLLNRSYPDDPDVPPQICYSNPGVSDFYAEEVLQYFRGGNVKGGWGNKMGTLSETETTVPRFPGKPFYYPIEGADNSSFCLCPACQEHVRPGNISRLKFNLLSEIARKAALMEPEAGVASLAYIQSLYYPEGLNLADNLTVQLCLTVYCWWHPIAFNLQHGEYKKWIEREGGKRPLTLWTYLFSPWWDSKHFGLYKPFPGLYPWKTVELFEEFLSDGIRGWFSEVQLRYNLLEAYVAARLCYDPSQNGKALIDEYFERCYGDAGSAIKEFYREIEDAYWNPANCPEEWLSNPKEFVGPVGKKHPFWGTGLHSPEINWQSGTEQRMIKLQGLIDQARELVKSDAEQLRLERLIADIWEPACIGKKEYEEMKQLSSVKRQLLIPKIADSGGDPLAVDWRQSIQSGSFTDAFGKSVSKECFLNLAHDQEYLYLKFTEKAAPTPGKMLWRENLEIFFASEMSYPVYHAGISPFGEKAGYLHELVNDSSKINPYDFEENLHQEIGPDFWKLKMAIPLKRLPFQHNRMIANFYRTWGAHGDFSVWSPTQISEYIRGLPRFGTLCMLPGVMQEKVFHQPASGTRIVQDPLAKDQRALAVPADTELLLKASPEAVFAGKRRVTFEMRAEMPADQEAPLFFTVGYHDPEHDVRQEKQVQIHGHQQEKYQAVVFSELPLTAEGYLYLRTAPSQSGRERTILLDQLIFE